MVILTLHRSEQEQAKGGAAIIRRWFEEVWNKGIEKTIDELYAEDGIAYGLGEPGQIVRGPAGFKPFWRQFRQAFPDFRFAVKDAIEVGNTAAGRWTATCTHRGELFGVPASGKKLELTGMVFIRVEHGQIIESWNNWDQHVPMRELGLK